MKAIVDKNIKIEDFNLAKAIVYVLYGLVMILMKIGRKIETLAK